MLTDLFLCGVGLVTGAMNAIAGGGMLIGFPAMLAVGLSPLVANVTANIVVLPGQLSSAYGYRRYLRRVPKYYAWLLVPCVIGGIIGATILRHTSSTQFEKLVPGLILFAVILFAAQPFLHFHLQKHMRMNTKARKKSHAVIFLIALALLPTATYGGYFGAGLGFIMLAFLGFTSLHDVHQMNAMKNIAAAVITGMSIVVLFSTHLIDWPHGLSMAVGSTIGGYFGAILAQKIPSHVVRILVIIIGLTAAVYLGLRTY
jgi:uncharacterized membrane protein YfcA